MLQCHQDIKKHPLSKQQFIQTIRIYIAKINIRFVTGHILSYSLKAAAIIEWKSL